ncbi:MAG TPA: hypothetical protein VLF93_00250 [Candidatus Saccharimonadales bacterium]|nr:hypothetical protein [Candidatus Saccharimonadales bacterium]
MRQLQKNWWKILPFFLFFLGWTGVILFIILLVIYGISRFVPIDPKRGKFLTWLILIDCITIVIFFSKFFIHKIPLDASSWFDIVSNLLEGVCVIGIWKWKKIAVVGFIVVTTSEFILAGVQGYDSSQPWFVNFSGILFLVVWLGLWILAFKRNWSRFT